MVPLSHHQIPTVGISGRGPQQHIPHLRKDRLTALCPLGRLAFTLIRGAIISLRPGPDGEGRGYFPRRAGGTVPVGPGVRPAPCGRLLALALAWARWRAASAASASCA